jgi:hypothetical protein
MPGGGVVAAELLRWNVDGASIVVETDEAETDGWAPAGVFGARTIHDAQVSLEQALENIGKAARAAVRAIHDGASHITQPAEIEVQFGVKFGTEAGVIIAKTSLEGQLNVTMRWQAGEQA